MNDLLFIGVGLFMMFFYGGLFAWAVRAELSDERE